VSKHGSMNEGDLALFVEYGEEYRQNDADDDTRRERKIEAELFSFNEDIPWQTSDVRNLVGEDEPETCKYEQHAEDDEHSADSRHLFPSFLQTF
jgi:hypothetical protein